MKISNHTILITGGTSGIGLALVKKFHELGNQIIVTGRNPAKLDALAENLDVHTFQNDLSDSNEVDKLITFIKSEHPKTNIIVNNAGVQHNYQVAEEMEAMAKIREEINTNYMAPLQLCAGLLPFLKTKTEAAIINVSSGLALVPKQSAPVYCSTKAGIHIFSKALRYQLEASNIKVFEIIPALVDTPMTKGRGKEKISPEQLVEEFVKAMKKDRFEVNIGKIKLLRFIQRLSPAMADKILKNS
ncbi:SDR family oxidoreductase [Fulvivirgaceae bacterium BMA10]|uniref:SDR family oxidoreductase n=1 Tax=Splendidivirga corallicola TaxID=3051826 RepID=A0ABT8KQN1_9BACT|nr:SDR family oxidoreductase [Fulvivirgaceae bacterium BMA10]